MNSLTFAKPSSLGELRRAYSISDMNPGDSELICNIYRQQILNEIEAFLVMNLAHTELVKLTPSLCMGNDNSEQPTLSEIYVRHEKALMNDTFALEIIHGYAHYYKGAAEKCIFDLNSDAKDYEASMLREKKFSLRKLNEKMKLGIESLGIVVND